MLKRLLSSKSQKTEANSDSSSDPPSVRDAERRYTSGSSFEDWGRRRNSTFLATNRRQSQLDPSISSRPSSGSLDSQANPLGLHVIYQPEYLALADIIFVHGLGGHSRNTWSKNHDPNFYWPQLWLPLDSALGRARIMSFGYNASFRPGSTRGLTNISDFAKELLYELGFGKNKSGEDLDIGSVPIIFVVHSMGGLVVKKAYLLGQNDKEYQNIVRSISAILFLATPHRGTNLAETLNKMLMASFQTPKSFITDLNRSSVIIEDLNEQFRHISPDLSIVSFYETDPTQVGPIKIKVVEKESANLGYQGEVSLPLAADHHEICKYPHPEHKNYLAIRNALKTLVGRLRSKGKEGASNSSRDAENIKRLLGEYFDSVDDFDFFRRRWVLGTCDWLFNEPDIESWLNYTPKSRIVWFTSPPGSGKSVLSAHIISHLQELGLPCQYFFFRFGDKTKRSISTLLRSIAYQTARDIPAFRRALVDLSNEGLSLENNHNPSFIWHKLFELILFRMELSEPLYWVIDALDESDDSKGLVDLLRGISSSQVPIRLLIVSRKTETLFLAFERLSMSVCVNSIEKGSHDHISDDIHLVVKNEMPHMRGGDELKQKVAQSIIDRAKGNFLWVQLVLGEILKCHTKEAIERVLEEVPDDMNELYQRMERGISGTEQHSNKPLAKALFQWAVCAHRLLTLKELSSALSPEFSEFLDLGRTIQDVCGQFVLVDRERVGIIHQTARVYLTRTSKEFLIDLSQAHGQLFLKSISALQDPKLRFKIKQGSQALQNADPFVLYAATSWTYHLEHADPTSNEALDILVKFFKNNSVLTWMSLIALVGRLELLVKASKVLTAFVNKIRKLNAVKNPMLHRLSDLALLDQWSVDLVKVVGKFSRHLLADPLAIYKLVPPFCPDNSALHRHFYNAHSAELSVSGISNAAWNDNLARIATPTGQRAWKIISAGDHIAVLCSRGTVFLWSSYNFTDICALNHCEPVTTIGFNGKGSKLVTCGLKSTKLWSIPSGKLLASTTSPVRCSAMEVVFACNDTRILSGSDDRVIRYLDIDDFTAGWHILDPSLLKETSEMKGTFINSPICVAFNADATQVGVSYRGFPLSVWDLNDFVCVGRCKRAPDPESDRAVGWFPVDRFTFNPVTGHVIGLYKDGTILKWHPETGENQEVRSTAHEVAASPDGRLFITSNANGVIKIWNFAYFTVIYQLSSPDLVTGLSFSPDSRRFYDLRGSTVNAWEPNSLTRFSEIDESTSDLTSEDPSPTSVSQISEASLTHYEAVSALTVSPDNVFYSVGSEGGVANIFETRTGKCIELQKFSKFFGVSHLTWSEDSRLVAASDLGGSIIIKRLVATSHGDLKNGTELEPLPKPAIDLERRGIHQMLFSFDSSLLLILGEDRAQIWGVDGAEVRASAKLENGTARRWIKHPTQKHLFLGFGPTDAKVYRWEDFGEEVSLCFQEGPRVLDPRMSYFPHDDKSIDLAGLSLNQGDGPSMVSVVNKAMLTQDGRHLLVQAKHGSSTGVEKRLLIFNISSFETDDAKNSAATVPTYSYIPPEIVARVEYPLGVLSGSRLVFLDSDLWVCTFKLGSAFDDFQRHYFVPRDWTSSEGLDLCCLTADGTLLYPKEDQVAVIRGSLEDTAF